MLRAVDALSGGAGGTRRLQVPTPQRRRAVASLAEETTPAITATAGDRGETAAMIINRRCISPPGVWNRDLG